MKSCKEVTLDHEKSKFTRLSMKEKLDIRLHSMICSKCRKYFKDSEKLDQWLTRRYNHIGGDYTFSGAEKEALKAKLFGKK